MQPAVSRPQPRASGQSRRGKQMNIDVPYPAPEQRVAVDECQDFRVVRDVSPRQVRKRRQHGFALPHVPQGKLANDEWMRKDGLAVKKLGKSLVIGA
jgi:hypothetical protein